MSESENEKPISLRLPNPVRDFIMTFRKPGVGKMTWDCIWRASLTLYCDVARAAVDGNALVFRNPNNEPRDDFPFVVPLYNSALPSRVVSIRQEARSPESRNDGRKYGKEKNCPPDLLNLADDLVRKTNFYQLHQDPLKHKNSIRQCALVMLFQFNQITQQSDLRLFSSNGSELGKKIESYFAAVRGPVVHFASASLNLNLVHHRKEEIEQDESYADNLISNETQMNWRMTPTAN